MVPLDTAPADLVTCEWPVDAAGDDAFGAPFIDVDERRSLPVAHRYVHGGFTGDGTRFSYYFPLEGYEGRFHQHVTPVPQSENLAPSTSGAGDKIAASARAGAYFVETNGGGGGAALPGSGLDPTIGAYRANAAAARFSRVVAARIYGAHHPFGYLYGGSGGAYRTLGAAENTVDVWHGFVPYVPGSPMAIPNMFSVRMYAQRVLRERFPAIVDAYDAGGDPSALDLSDEEHAALAEVTRMGFPPRSWFGWRTMGMHAFSVLYPGVMMIDPTYPDDFWSAPGYLGADPASSVHVDRMRASTAVRDLLTDAAPAVARTGGGVDESFSHAAGDRPVVGVRLADAPAGWALGAELIVRSGASAGATLRVQSIDGDTARLEPGQDPAVVAGLAVGDEVTVDNGNFLAAQTYHRHQVPDATYAGWDQFRDADGAPVYPQRPLLIGPIFTANASGAVPTGAVAGTARMIMVASLLDREALPWQADWYRGRLEEHVGDAADDRFRLWYVDNALHGDDEEQEHPTRTVSYLGVLDTALRQLARWVETGQAPSASSHYAIEDAQVAISRTDPARGGVQPVVAVRVGSGEDVTRVAVGQVVPVHIEAHVASGVGALVELVVDLDGDGAFDETIAIPVAADAAVEREVAFAAPGTYLIAARVAAQTEGDAGDPFARVHNIARARIVVA